jgi:hypothetical protein
MKKFRRITLQTVIDNNFIQRNDQFRKELLEYFEKTNWVHANPAKYNCECESCFKNKEFREILQHIYFTNDKIRNGLETLEKAILNENIPYIFITGRRGSGKTFFQNYFLNVKTKKLNEQRYTWIRVDCTKIYHYNSLRKSYEKRIDKIITYIWAQLVFVYVRYKQPHYADDNNYSLSNTGHVCYSEDKVFSSLDENKVFAGLDSEAKNEIISKIRSAHHENNSLDGKLFFDSRIETIAKNILEELKQKDKKIALFIDGIDNIDFKYGAKKLFQRLLEPLYPENLKEKFFDTIIITTRDEYTLPLPFLEYIQKNRQYEDKIFISTNGFIDHKKFWDNFFKNLKGNKLFKINFSKEKIENFVTFVENSTSIISKQIKNMGIDFNRDLSINENDFCLLQHLYDNDIREMKNGLLQSFIYVEEFIKNNNTTLHTVLEKKPYIVMEALFKNGMRYAPDIRQKKFTPPYRNLGFTNLFNPTEEIVVDSIIPPLLFVYILKILFNDEGFTLKNLTDKLKKNLKGEIFDSIKDYIQKAFEHLLEYNYVYMSYEQQNKLQEILHITKKGLIVYHTIFRNIDILHANIYYAAVYEDYEPSFGAFDPTGKKYIIKTLENVAKYLYFLEQLQKDMLEEPTEENELFINFYTENLVKTYQKLYFNEKGNISLSDEIFKFAEKRFLANLPNCIHILKNNKYRNNIQLINDSKLTFDGIEERIKMVHELLLLKEKETNLNDFLEEIYEQASLRDFIKATESNKGDIKSVMEKYESMAKNFEYINKLCKELN